MSPRALRRLFLIYGAVLVVVAVGLRTWFSLSVPKTEVVVETWWKDGANIGRQVFERADKNVLVSRMIPDLETTRVEEVVVGRGPLLRSPEALLTLGLVPGRDGVEATIGDKTVYATVDDLMSIQAYDREHLYFEASFGWGTHLGLLLHVLSKQLEVPASEVLTRATLHRVRLERRVTQEAKLPQAPRPDAAGRTGRKPAFTWPAHVSADDLSRPMVLEAIAETATHLARSVDAQGQFRYLIDAPRNMTVPGYNWPRHSGATFFLAQAAALVDDPFIRYACLRAAGRLRDEMMRDCGATRCIAGADATTTEVGSSALALIAFTEIVRSGLDGAYRPAVAQLAGFLRSQQRPDGELMHLYDRVAKKPIDVQYLYYTGEAALGLARAHSITGDPRDLEAAKKALGRLSGAGWSFFGSRYYFSEEHWTCQAVAELWERAPDPEALAFCSRWHEFQRRLQQDPEDSPFDAEGSFGFGPIVAPRVTPAASRGEAAGALEAVLIHEKAAGRGAAGKDELPLVDRELRHALAFVLRSQFHPGPTHLFADPTAVRGALPGSPVDWQLRIDYAQHAGCMMVRWLEVDALLQGSGANSPAAARSTTP